MGATFEKVDKTIAWFEQISRKFSIIFDEIIGLGKHDIVLTCEHDKRYRTSKTTKTNPLDCFSKIYYFVPRDRVCANSVADCCSSKLQFFEPPVKMARKTLCVNLLTQFARNFTAKLFKKFLVLFSKRTLFLIKLTFYSPINPNLVVIFLL